MRALGLLGCTLALVAAGTAWAGAPTVTRSGDVSLITSLKMTDGETGAPGYATAIWTTAQPVRATLVARNAKGRLVETVAYGNPYTRTAGISWIEPSGMMANRSFAPAGIYHITVVVTAYAPGSLSQLSSRSETLVWSAKVPDHTKLCVPKVTSSSYIGCG